MKIFRIFLVLIFIIGLVYVAIPVSSSVFIFPPLPDSVKSNLDGDTWQNPNLVAYYSDFRREYITKFYKESFAKMHLFGFLIPPVSLNHPPEYAYKYVRDQQESTFLEEYTYPLRESLFVNGYDPLVEGIMIKGQLSFMSMHVIHEGEYFDTKTTLRYYPSNPLFRIAIYLSIWMLSLMLFKLYQKEFRV